MRSRRIRRWLATLAWVSLMGWTLVAFGAAVRNELKPDDSPPPRLHQCEEDEAQYVTPQGLACIPVDDTNIDEVVKGLEPVTR